MSTTFSTLLDTCEAALNDAANAVWTRAKLIIWAREAMAAFPIPRPRETQFTYLSDTYQTDMAADFREIVSVEFPLNGNPPDYLTRMSRFDEHFFDDDTHYDVDYNFADGKGWVLWTSKQMVNGTDSIRINYLANHDISCADNSADLITVSDEYVHVLVAYVVMQAYQERLSTYMQDPTAYSQIIYQFVQSLKRVQDNYAALVKDITSRIAHSRITSKLAADKYDRVY